MGGGVIWEGIYIFDLMRFKELLLFWIKFGLCENVFFVYF